MLPFRNTDDAEQGLSPSLGYRPEDQERFEELLSFLNVSKRILARRVELGLSQDSLGRAAGSKQSKISEIELMKGDPRLSTLNRIARQIGLVVDLVPIAIALKGTPFERPEPSVPDWLTPAEGRTTATASPSANVISLQEYMASKGILAVNSSDEVPLVAAESVMEFR